MIQHDTVELELVNRIRERVRRWREAGYPGVTPITRQLLSHWNQPIEEYKEQKLAEKGTLEGTAVPAAGRRTFFAQREAAETIIWLTEAPSSERAGIGVPKEHPERPLIAGALRWPPDLARQS
jgi:type III restriction enzyme